MLLWKRSAVEGDDLRGYFAAETCTRPKWVYVLPCLGALAVAVLTRSPLAAIIAVQMFGGGLLCVLTVGLVEQGTYQRLDAMAEVPSQDHHDFLWRWVLTAAIFGLGALGMALSGWDFIHTAEIRQDMRRGTLVLHLFAVLGGVWALAHIAHPPREIHKALKLMMSRRISPAQREELGPMARQLGTNAVVFGAIGSITWIGLHAPMIGRGATAAHFAMGLTPLLAGMIWSFFFRWRGRGLGVLKRRGVADSAPLPGLHRPSQATQARLWNLRAGLGSIHCRCVGVDGVVGLGRTELDAALSREAVMRDEGNDPAHKARGRELRLVRAFHGRDLDDVKADDVA